MLFKKALVFKPLFIKAPSVVLQRIIIVVLFSAVGAATWWQNPENNDSYTVRKVTARPLASDVSDIDFGAAEAAWSEVEINSAGTFAINASAELALSEVIALMSDEAFDVQLERMALLVEKQFGGGVQREFAELLPVLKNYQDLEQRWWEENGSTMPPAYAELFRLQDEVVGEDLASKLFSEQRRLAKMMLAGYHIQNDAELTQEEKDQALANLQSSFEVGGVNE